MTTRVLPPDEWPRLEGTELEAVWPLADPSVMTVLVVEDGDQIIGCWSALSVVHVEGLWIHPAYQKRSSVGRRLWRGMTDVVRSAFGASSVVTAACSDEVRALLQTAGATMLPGESYVMQMKGRASCRQP